MTWLEPAVTATCIGTTIVSLTYLYLYLMERKNFLLHWTVSWVLYSFRLGVMLLFLSQDSPLLLILNQSLALWSTIFLFTGARAFLERIVHARLIVGLAFALNAWIVFAVLAKAPFMYMALPAFTFSGLVYVLTGATIIRNVQGCRFERLLSGWVFILWGLHKANYPFLRPVEWFAPWGYMIGAVMALMASISILLLYLRLSKESLLESEERFRSTFEQAAVGMAHVGLDGKWLRVNKRLCDILGYPPDEFSSLRFQDVTYPDDLDEDLNNVNALIQNKGGRYNMEKRYIRKDGSIVWANLTVSLVCDPEGAPDYFISAIEDIDARKQSEEQLIEMKRQADAANEAKSIFLANMSHEVRTPLNGVMGMLQLMKTAELSEEQSGYVDIAIGSCRRLTNLLSDILDLSAIESGKSKLKSCTFSIADVFSSVESLYHLAAKEAGNTLHFEIDAALPQFLVGDEQRLVQILFNLVGNSIKYTRGGTISLEAWKMPSHSADASRVLFVLADTGIGIPDELLGHVFEKFAQVDQSFTRKYQGAGLGLPIVKEAVKLMGGSLVVDSNLDQGSVFYVSLPFAPAVQSGATACEEPTKPGRVEGKARVLLVEDDQVSAMTIARFLEKLGHNAVTAENGQQALDKIMTDDFDIVLMDIQMPVLDGVAATKRIRQGEAGKKNSGIPIIAMTAYAMAGDKESFLDAGMDDYLAKPVDMQELHDVLNRQLNSGGV